MIDQADTPFKLKVKDELAGMKTGSKPKYEIPSHLPILATLRFVLTHCCEIRSVPRKVDLINYFSHFINVYVK